MTFARNGWYCAALTAEVGDTPMARRILNQPIMLVRDAVGDVRAIGDRCPHRFAPLHQGVRDDDTIECPYHGLRFDLNGACVFNPHGQGRIPAAAHVPSYPVVERDQLLPLLEDSLRRLHLSDLRAASRDLAQKLEAGGMDVEQERDLLAQKVQLDRQIQSTLSHFGTVILP